MKVAIDILPLKTGHRYRGIGIYTENLVQTLQSIKLPDFNLILKREKEIPRDCDLVHYPYFDLFWLTLPIRKVKPTAVTIHDVIPLLFPEHYPPGIKGAIKFQIQKFSLKGIGGVITDSENSKKDIVKYLNYPEEKIYVVYLAPGEIYRPLKITDTIYRCIVSKYKLPKIFVLYVGDINYNKNVPSLVRACEKIGIPLVIVGKQATQADIDRNHPENQDLVWLQDYYQHLAPNTQHLILTGFVLEEDLVAIYNLATVYCQPSLYEGFGLPILEAMACGCPVVTSDRGSLPELCDEAAIVINPDKIDSITKGVRDLMGDKSKREQLIKKGFAQAKRFSWKKTTLQTIEVYQRITKGCRK